MNAERRQGAGQQRLRTGLGQDGHAVLGADGGPIDLEMGQRAAAPVQSQGAQRLSLSLDPGRDPRLLEQSEGTGIDAQRL